MTWRLYILNADNRPQPCNDIIAWAQWFEDTTNRIVGYTQITSEMHVSTIFLGIDHRHFGKGPPTLFETMIFGGPLSDSQCAIQATMTP